MLIPGGLEVLQGLEIILSSMATGLRSPESQAEALASRLEGWTGLQGVVSSHLPDKAPQQASTSMPNCLCSSQAHTDAVCRSGVLSDTAAYT